MEKLQIWDDQSLHWNTPPLRPESGRSYVETNLYLPWIPSRLDVELEHGSVQSCSKFLLMENIKMQI